MVTQAPAAALSEDHAPAHVHADVPVQGPAPSRASNHYHALADEVGTADTDWDHDVALEAVRSTEGPDAVQEAGRSTKDP